MRIPCPFCGERESSEFVSLGDALTHFVDAVYLRDNLAGAHEELWYHASGCRGWLRLTRDTLTHEIRSVVFANGSVA